MFERFSVGAREALVRASRIAEPAGRRSDISVKSLLNALALDPEIAVALRRAGCALLPASARERTRTTRRGRRRRRLISPGAVRVLRRAVRIADLQSPGRRVWVSPPVVLLALVQTNRDVVESWQGAEPGRAKHVERIARELLENDERSEQGEPSASERVWAVSVGGPPKAVKWSDRGRRHSAGSLSRRQLEIEIAQLREQARLDGPTEED